jgi:hypothetical protein
MTLFSQKKIRIKLKESVLSGLINSTDPKIQDVRKGRGGRERMEGGRRGERGRIAREEGRKGGGRMGEGGRKEGREEERKGGREEGG